uniref:Reverse transcriptase domain-containing protein n=1 Tax=Photinus pyralis TaxID=7054 RepID=A0A1Y1KBA2_PHOPY
MVNDRLVWVIESRSRLSKYQTGFRRFHSTTDNLVYLENNIQNTFLHRQHMIAVSFDLEKAYDMTWRYNVMSKLHNWGLRGNLPAFIKNFLSHRTFRTRIGDTLSQIHTMENGIPQGSVMSCTLFLIAVDDLVSSIQKPLNACLYVDDLIICTSSENLEDIQTEMQDGINKVVEVAENIGFRFSSEKTVTIHFCRLRHEHADPVLNIRDSTVRYLPSIKILGVIFDSKLYFREHIEALENKC